MRTEINWQSRHDKCDDFFELLGSSRKRRTMKWISRTTENNKNKVKDLLNLDDTNNWWTNLEL